jgi:hypothetical protein
MLFPNAIVAVSQKQPDAGNADKEGYVSNAALSAVKMNIQPATAEVTVLVEGAFGKTYTGFTSVSGIAIGNRLTVSGTGDVYYVRGVKNWNQPPMPHFEYTFVSE